MILIAIAAAAATVTIPFAPPVTPLRYETVQIRETSQGKVRFTVVRTVRFVPAGEGWRLEMTLTDYSTDATENSLAVFEAGAGALKGVTFAYSIGRTGTIIAPIDPDRIWAKLVESDQAVLHAVETDPRVSPEKRAGVRAILASVENVPPEARRRRMLDDVQPLTDHAGISAPVGQAAPFGQTPAGGARISGSETLTDVADGVARFVLDSRSDASQAAALSVSEHVETDVSTTTGLLIRLSRTRATTGPGNAAQTLDETRTLAPTGS